MSSTNKTTNYELSQFLGTDKPAWLNDYNADMGKIDTGIHTAQTTATGADGKADANTTAIGTLANLTTEVKTDLVSAVNEVKTDAGSAQNIANSAVLSANTANTAISNLESYLNISTINTYTKDDFSATAGTMASTSIKVARNVAGTLAKIYGYIRHKPTSTGLQTINLNIDTGLRPESNTIITPVGNMWVIGGSNGVGIPEELTITVKTNGYLTINYTAEFIPTSYYLGYAFPSLYFIQNWGDVPSPE